MRYLALLLLVLLASEAADAIPGCHNGDWSCPEDNYCSEGKQKCWPCREIAMHYCQNWTAIQERFKECASYCIKMELQKKEMELNETHGKLQREREDKQKVMTELQTAKRMLITKDDEIKQLNETVQNVETVDDESKPYLPGFVINLLVGIVCLLAGGGVVCIWKKYRNKPRSQAGANGEQGMPLVEPAHQQTQTVTIVTHPTASPEEEGYGSSSTVVSRSEEPHHAQIHAQQMTRHDSNPQFAV